MISSAANASPQNYLSLGDPIVLISVPEVQVETFVDESFFREAGFDREVENIKFVTKHEVESIQIFDKTGALIYQLPVNSKYMRLNRRVFGESGRYKVGFVTSDMGDIKFANVSLR